MIVGTVVPTVIVGTVTKCTELAWDTRAGDANNSQHDEPNDDLALLVGMIRLVQLFNLY